MQYKLEKPIHATIGSEKYQCTIQWRNGKFITDEPQASGGKDTGPDPYTLLLSSLATCTLVTMRMYIERNGWTIPQIAISVNMYRQTKDGKITTIIDRDIIFSDETQEEQKMELLDIAERCPVSKILEGTTQVRTFILKEAKTKKTLKYANDEITIVWRSDLCQHATRCRSQLPEVFDYEKKPWINPNGASTQEITEQIKKCPSGALRYTLNKS